MKANQAITKTCPCGDNFYTTQAQLDRGQGKYCSKACLYKYRVRPTGLKYNIKTVNPGWFGQRGKT